MDTRLPGRPCGSRATAVCWKTLGLVSSVERYAEIASWIQQATPEARKRLSEASSHEKTSGVMPSSKSALSDRNPSRRRDPAAELLPDPVGDVGHIDEIAMVEGGQDGADEIDEVVTRPGGQLGGEARRQVQVGDAVDADLHPVLLAPLLHEAV